MVRKVGFCLLLGYIGAIIFIFYKYNLQRHDGCGNPPINGCIERQSIQTIPRVDSESTDETLDISY